MKITIGVGHCPYCGEDIAMPLKVSVYCPTEKCDTFLYMYDTKNYRARSLAHPNLEGLKIKELWSNQKSFGIYAKIFVDGTDITKYYSSPVLTHKPDCGCRGIVHMCTSVV